MDTRYDAIVVGGGPAGATSATLLARAGWRVAVIEKASFPRRKVCGEFISATTWPLLRALGVAESLLAIAGPAVRRIELLAGDAGVDAALPAPLGAMDEWGRAVGREHLDTQLLRQAASSGADVWQPWQLADFVDTGGSYVCTIAARGTRPPTTLQAPLVIAAHGSWECGAMPTQVAQRAHCNADLFGFKAHLRATRLATDLMPLLAFPGGYGGLVHTDGGRVSLSCCIRRDELERSRRQAPHGRAGEAVLAHIRKFCVGADAALADASVEGAWLSAGPLRTGFHSFGHGGVFTVGNATAEAHPVVAEGLSMAMQSAALLCAELIAAGPPRGESPLTAPRLRSVRARYARAWRQHFSRRLKLAWLAAHVFMRPDTTGMAMTLVQRLPWILSAAARWSGKAQTLQLERVVLGLSQ